MLSPAPSTRHQSTAEQPSLLVESRRSVGRLERSQGRAGRESSREAVISAPDPILARYLAIKRALDGSSKQPSAARRSTVPQSSATSFTPGGSAGFDARAILNSPTPTASAVRHGSPAPVPAHQHQQQPYQRSSEKDQQISQLSQVVAESLASKRSLEEALEERGREVQRLGMIIAEMRGTYSHHPRESQQQPADSDGLLQGRVKALEALLQSKDTALDQERAKSAAFERKISNMAAQNDELQAAIAAKDRLAGQQQVSASTDKQEALRLRQQLDEYAERERATRLELARVEAIANQRLTDAERLAQERKEDQRQHANALRALEGRTNAHDEMVREMESQRSRHDDEKRLMDAELHRLHDQLRSVTTKLEATKTLSAQESIVTDELKYEIGRYKKVVAELRDEILAQEEAREEVERHVTELEKDRKAKVVAEGQLRAAQAKLSEMELETDGLRASLDDARRRLHAALEDCQGIPALEQQVGELRSLLQGKALTVERLNVMERDHISSIERLKSELDAARLSESAAQHEVSERSVTISRLERRVEELGAELRQRNSLAEDLRDLRRALDDKDAEAQRLRSDVSAWQDKCRELNNDVETLLSIKQQFDVVVAERQELFASIDGKEAEIVELHREAAVAIANIRQKDEEVHDAREMAVALEGQLQRQAQQLTDRASLEGRVRQLTQEVAIQSHEIMREKDRTADALSRLAAKDEALEAERARRTELEQRGSELLQEVGRAQLEQGKCAVMLEASEREVARAAKDLEARVVQCEQLSAELSATRRQLQAKEADAQSSAVQLRIVEERSAQLASQLAAYQDELTRLRSVIEQQDARTLQLEGTAAAAMEAAQRETQLRARADDLERVAQRREAEALELSVMLSQLREKNRETAAEAQLAAKLRVQLADARTAAEKQQLLLDSFEKEDAAKAKQLLEKEREVSRLKERAAALGADLDAERTRKKAVENRLKELEADSSRAATLDGQVAGLNIIVAQRTQDLEEERSANAELRARLRGNDRSASQRALQATSELETKLAAKEEAVLQLETELKKKQVAVEQLRRELESCDDSRRSAEAAHRERRAQLEQTEAQWSAKYAALERLHEAAKAANKDVADVSRLLDELSEQKRRNAMLTMDLQNSRAKEAAAGGAFRPSAATTSVVNTSTASVSSLTRGLASSDDSMQVVGAGRQSSLELSAAEAEIRMWRERRLQRRQEGSLSPTRGKSATNQSPSRRE
jgi:chromosome segregation ATPase